MRYFLPCLLATSLLIAFPALAQETTPVHGNPFTTPETPAPAVQAVKAPPANPLPMGDYTKYYAQQTASVTLGGQPAEMTYFLFQPERPWAEGARFPLVLVLHDGGGDAPVGNMLIAESVRKKYPAFVLVPALPADKRWRDSGPLKPSHSLSAAIEIMKQVTALHPAVDPARMYVIGCGMGGNGAYGAAHEYADIFAAAVPITAAWNPREIGSMNKIPLAAFHGRDDKIVSHYSSTDTVTSIQQSGGTAYFTAYDNLGHDCKSDRIHNDLLWQWMFSQKRK